MFIFTIHVFADFLECSNPDQRADGLSYARNKIRPAHVPTRFWNGDEEEEDASWKAIEAGHGLVSVTPEWAADRNLPDSLIHPRDPTKRVYVIEAYHSIHCLVTSHPSNFPKIFLDISTNI